MNNEPVAWWTGKFEDECDDFMFHETRLTHVQSLNSKTHTLFPIPLYTHPVKELTDAEIQQVSHKYHYTYNPDYIGFARAILRKVQGDV